MISLASNRKLVRFVTFVVSALFCSWHSTALAEQKSMVPAVGSLTVMSHKQTKSGVEYQSDDIQSMQADEFANPGLLFVDQGEKVFRTRPSTAEHGEAKSCLNCHEDMRGVAGSFPKLNPRTEQLLSLTGQVLECRQHYQQLDGIEYESQLALSLTAYVAYQSKAARFDPVASELNPALERGKQYYYQRKGQLNLACHHCHEQNAGRQLRGDLISQGVSTGYPIYRLEWQGLGSLHRRFRACDIGVRAEPMIIGGQVYTELELYLRHRAGELPLSAPAVRR